MVEYVAATAIENYKIFDLDGHIATPFSSFKIKRLVALPQSKFLRFSHSWGIYSAIDCFGLSRQQKSERW